MTELTDWIGVGMDAFTGVATLAAVWAAFRIQKKQASDDQRNLREQIAADRDNLELQLLDERRRRALEERLQFEIAEGVATNAVTTMRTICGIVEAEKPIDTRLCTQNLQRLIRVIEYFLSRDLPDSGLVTVLVSLKDILEGAHELVFRYVPLPDEDASFRLHPSAASILLSRSQELDSLQRLLEEIAAVYQRRYP